MEKLSQHVLLEIQRIAEYGRLRPDTVSKRHLHILSALCEERGARREYMTIETIRGTIKQTSHKEYEKGGLVYWVKDLLKRGYLDVLDDETEIADSEFRITDKGVHLLRKISRSKKTKSVNNSPSVRTSYAPLR